MSAQPKVVVKIESEKDMMALQVSTAWGNFVLHQLSPGGMCL